MRTRRAGKLEHFSFDVACVQCGYPHSHQQVQFARVALRIASCVLRGLGLSFEAAPASCGQHMSFLRVTRSVHMDDIDTLGAAGGSGAIHDHDDNDDDNNGNGDDGRVIQTCLFGFVGEA